MRKDIGESLIKVGTNVSSLGAAAVIFFEDGLTVVSGIIASLFGLLIVLMGVYVRDGRIK